MVNLKQVLLIVRGPSLSVQGRANALKATFSLHPLQELNWKLISMSMIASRMICPYYKRQNTQDHVPGSLSVTTFSTG